jgi:hypothetical protein
MVPFMPALKSTFSSVEKYLQSWQNDINRIFGGKIEAVPTPFDRSNFFLDDVLQFKSIAIYEDIQDDFILSVIGPSRTLSLSLFIEPIYMLRKRLLFDQRLELCFAASFLSNPFWFDHVLRLLIHRDTDPQDPFQFGLHPFLDWVQTTQATFGGNWQGGPHNRWSPCGGGTPVVELFGAGQNASDKEKEVGRLRLERVISILHKHVSWIDSLGGRGDNCIEDMPIHTLREQMEATRKEIHAVVACQFSLFRLSIFTTLIIGCGEVQPGRHLRQLMFPIKNTASYQHLMNTSIGKISKQQANELCKNINAVTNDGNTRVSPECHDLAMLYLSTHLNLSKYNRDEMECVLCESIPGRNLSCVDWFRKGQRLFDLDQSGQPLVKEYGQASEWEAIQTYDKLCNCAYLTPYIVFIPRNDIIMQFATETGRTMRTSSHSLVFEGRCTRTSNSMQQYSNDYASSSAMFPAKTFEYRAANFYCHLPKGIDQATGKMRVLGNSVPAKSILTEANCLNDFPVGMSLMDHISWLLKTRGVHSMDEAEKCPMFAACYHQEITRLSNNDAAGDASYFPGHRDKCFVYQAIFVPLTERVFYSFLGVPNEWNMYQDAESYRMYSKWRSSLTVSQRTRMRLFETNFQKDAQWHMKLNVKVLIFANQLGSVFAFPANTCYHATVIPGNDSSANGVMTGRDLLIIHPLDLAMGRHCEG